ncbi:MAG: hypothetical protein ACI93T_001725, partial [Porticoccaceae bacterium]
QSNGQYGSQILHLRVSEKHHWNRQIIHATGI